MDSFELNKIAGAILFALLVIVSARTVTNIIFTVHKPEKPGMEVEIAEPAQADKKDGGKAEIPLAQLLKEGDATRGQKAIKACAACHTFDDGGKNRIGPNLYGIVGQKLAGVDGFAYSEALTGKGGTWGYEEMDAFLANPKAFAPGTKMAYAGLKNAKKRADLILYLRSLGGTPPPLPDVAAPAETEKPAPAEKKEDAKADDKPPPAANAAAPGQAEKPAPAENKEEAKSGETPPPAPDAAAPAQAGQPAPAAQ